MAAPRASQPGTAQSYEPADLSPFTTTMLTGMLHFESISYLAGLGGGSGRLLPGRLLLPHLPHVAVKVLQTLGVCQSRGSLLRSTQPRRLTKLQLPHDSCTGLACVCFSTGHLQVDVALGTASKLGAQRAAGSRRDVRGKGAGRQRRLLRLPLPLGL